MNQKLQPTESWEEQVARFAVFPGVVAELDDPLTWGLDLVAEQVTGGRAPDDPTELRFERIYRSFAGEEVALDTLPQCCAEPVVDDLLRAALSDIAAGPLLAADEVDDLVACRTELQAIMNDVDAAVCRDVVREIEDHPTTAIELTTRGMAAAYLADQGRAVVIAGPADLVRQVSIVLRPVPALLET